MKPDKKTFIYIGIVLFISIFILGYLFLNYEIINLNMLLFWSLLSVIVESLLILLPNEKIGVSVGFAIDLAAVIIGGPLLGTISSAVGFLFRCPNIPGKGYQHIFNTPFYITIFNMAQNIIGTGIMGIAYIYISGTIGIFNLIPTIFIVLLGTFLNSVIISGLMSVLNKEEFTKVWIGNIRGTILSSLAVGILGIIMALAYIGYGYGAVLLFFGPLLLARYSFKLYVDMRNTYISTIEGLNKAIETKDPYTSGHATRVKEYSVMLGEAYGLNHDKIEKIKTAAILHDIGKIGINDSILNKRTKLTQKEYEEIKTHPCVGADIISKMDLFKDVATIVRCHHERYDGQGYPEGLRGNEIPIEASILAISDSYDAMTSDRAYRKGLSKEKALLEIKENKGVQFHPELAEKFIEVME